MDSPSPESSLIAKHLKAVPSEPDGSPAGIPGSSSADRRTPGSVGGKVPEKRGNKSQAWPQRTAIGMKLRLNRELCLAEKRLECDVSCPEWGQPDHMVPSLSAQLQQALHKLLDPLKCQFLDWR